MQETHFDTRACLDEEGLLHTFHYTLLTEQISTGHFILENYGVQVEETGGARTRLCCLTHSRDAADKLLSLLVRHVVTPTSLGDVVEDWAKKNRLPFKTADGN